MAKPRKSQKSQTTPKLSERQIKRKNEEDFIEELETKIQEFVSFWLVLHIHIYNLII